MEQKKDIKLVCKRCGESFIFTVNDQIFYESQGWETVPQKCSKCRAEIKRLRKTHE